MMVPSVEEAETGLANFDVLVFDIEGTVCPIAFVKDVLFPYALTILPDVLLSHWDDSEFIQYRRAFPKEYREDRQAFEDHVRDLVQRDVKIAYLKSLQGFLWERGYEVGDLKAPLFPDVAPFITAAHAKGKKIIIYSSGSVRAQKLLFGHNDGNPTDLRPFITDWFDTVNAGPKCDASSYQRILSQYPDTIASRWIFFSDNLAEVDAALQSGMNSLPLTRPGNTPLPMHHHMSKHAIRDFTPKSLHRAEASIQDLVVPPK